MSHRKENQIVFGADLQKETKKKKKERGRV